MTGENAEHFREGSEDAAVAGAVGDQVGAGEAGVGGVAHQAPTIGITPSLQLEGEKKIRQF